MIENKQLSLLSLYLRAYESVYTKTIEKRTNNATTYVAILMDRKMYILMLIHLLP